MNFLSEFIHFLSVCSHIKIIENQVENFLPYLTGKKQLTPRARDLTFCNWATNKVSDLSPGKFNMRRLNLVSELLIFRPVGVLPLIGR